MSYVDDTKDHITRVAKLMLDAAGVFRVRGAAHDRSKFSPEERETYERVVPKIQAAEREHGYGSEEYKAAIAELGPALAHHYENNSHHPEHYENGVSGMTLFDVHEMLCDWIAVCQQRGGDIHKSLEINKQRFGIDDQLYQILKNTIDAQRSAGEAE